MTRKIGRLAAGLVAALAVGAPAQGPTAPPVVVPESRLIVTSFGLGPEPAGTEEILVRDGRTYRFAAGSVEVVVVDPGRKVVELVDLGRKLRSEITFDQLDGSLARVRRKLEAAVADRRATGKRADAVEADMTGNLIDLRFRRVDGPKPGQLRLTNPTVEVDAIGVAEPDPARLGSLALPLAIEAKLGAFLAPDDLPPFAELETLAALDRFKLRPAEIAYLYRLAGPPRKFRRTYRLVPDLTLREREAVARVDRIRAAATLLRYERYRAAQKRDGNP